MPHLQKSKVARISTDKCIRCKACPPMEDCDAKAISRLDPDETPYVEIEFCLGCGSCIKKCPASAIST